MIGTLHAEVFTTLDGERYANATIKRVEPDGLVVGYSEGVKKLKFRNLPPEIGQRYGYSSDAEMQYLNQRKTEDAAAYERAVAAREEETNKIKSRNSLLTSLAPAPAISAKENSRKGS